MQLLLEDQTTPTEGSAVSLVGPCTVFVRGLENGFLSIEISPNVTPPRWAKAINGRTFDTGFVVNCVGPYKIRAVLKEVSEDTNCTVYAEEE